MTGRQARTLVFDFLALVALNAFSIVAGYCRWSLLFDGFYSLSFQPVKPWHLFRTSLLLAIVSFLGVLAIAWYPQRRFPALMFPLLVMPFVAFLLYPGREALGLTSDSGGMVTFFLFWFSNVWFSWHVTRVLGVRDPEPPL